MSTASNRSLSAARRARKDEFYTQLPDIENELRHYKAHFKGKVVYCNCDDPRVSQFFHYFSYGFERLGLKKLIATCYKNQNPDIFSENACEKAVWLEYNGDRNQNRVPDANEIGVKDLQGDGDFRSAECIELLKQADVVVTNPPFSLFREYVAQLVEYGKKFVIIGSMNAVSYKEIFKLIKENKIWFGYGFKSGNAFFKTNYPKEFAKGVYDEATGLVKFRNVMWFTNLDHNKRHEDLILYQTYKGNESAYPKFDNYDVISIDRTKEIPKDYSGVMGVPISFLDRYNPDQFEIVGCDYDVKEGVLSELVRENWDGKLDRAYLNGERQYSRIFIRSK